MSSSSIIRTKAIQRLFQIVEQRYGGNLPIDTGEAAEVLVADKYLCYEHLYRLMNHTALAIHVKNFYPSSYCTELCHQLLSDDDSINQRKNWKISTNRGLESSDVITIGEHDPFNVASSVSSSSSLQDSKNNSSLEEYFTGVQNEVRKRRINPTTNQPQLWPLDLLRLQLDENWPAGAGLASYDPKNEQSTTRYRISSLLSSLLPSSLSSTNLQQQPPPPLLRKLGGGLTRVMYGPTRWSKGYIHVDEMGPLYNSYGLFSANIYLQLPNTDNNNNNNNNNNETNNNNNNKFETLHIWPLGIRSKWDWYRNAILLSGLGIQDASAQSLLRAKLGIPIAITAQPGDLILFCVQRPHAAVGFQSGTRISLQCFIQHTGIANRLLIDC